MRAGRLSCRGPLRLWASLLTAMELAYRAYVADGSYHIVCFS